MALEPRLAEAHVNLGVWHERQGDAGGALRHYLAAVRAKDSLFAAHHNLGRLLMGHHTERAVAHLRRAVILRPDDADAAANLGEALWATGQREEGIAALRRALELRPRWARAANRMAELLLEMTEEREGAADEAARWADAACRAVGYTQSRYLATLARAWEAAGRADRAEGARLRARERSRRR